MLVLILILFALVQVGTAAYDMGYRIFTEPAMESSPGRDVTVEIRQGMSASEIGNLLEEKQLINTGTLFMIQSKVSAYEKRMKPGIYTLNTSLTSREMMQIMAKEETEEAEK